MAHPDSFPNPSTSLPVADVLASGPAWLAAMPLAAILCGPRGSLIGWNTAAAGLFGDTLRAGMPGARLFAGQAHDAAGGTEETSRSPLARALREDAPVRVAACTIVAAHATDRVVGASFAPVRGADGTTAGVLGTFQPREQDELEDFFENSPVALHLVAGDGTILRANQAELDLLGYRREDYVGQPISAFHADADVLAQLHERLHAGERVERYPVRLRAADGSIRQVRLSSSPRRGGDGFINSRSYIEEVTAEQQRDAAAGELERRSNQLLQALPAAVYTTDTQGTITFYNEAAVAFAGRRPQPGDKWCVSWKLYCPDGTLLPHDECPLAVALREQRPILGEEAISERPDGTRVAFIAHPTPLFDDAGVMTGALNMLVDITDRKNAEQALQEINDTLEQRIAERDRLNDEARQKLVRSERNFSLLVGSVVDYAIFMLDPAGNVTNWNAGAERIKGYRADDVVGRHFSAFYTPEDRAAGVPETALATARNEGRFEDEGWRVRKDGSRFLAHTVIDPIRDQGELIGFAKITRDVTERKAATLALTESERRARGVIDTALDGFVQLDQDGRVLEWNPRAEAMFGLTRAQALSRPLDELIVAPDDRERYRDAWLPTLQQRLPHGQLRQIEARRQDGKAIVVELSVSTLRLSSGELRNVFIHDMTEELLIDAKLRQAQKMDAVGQLTGGIAHDFNNLLQGIIGSLDLIQLRLEQQQTANLGRFIDGAMSSAKRAAGLIHRLLAFSRRQPLDPKPVSANPRIASMEELLRRTLGEQVNLELVLAPGLWMTRCDPNQLDSALLNLAINARDAMPDGGLLTICSSNVEIGGSDGAAAPSQFICIEVTDTGTGMDADVVEHAFDPFFTTKPTGQGTGLGLSMVYGFARQSNGHCEIHSKPGRGTCVQLYLPRLLEAADATEETAAPQPIAAQRDGGGDTVLVVEDDPVVRSIVVEVLRQLGHHALEAADGSTGLDLLLSDTSIDLLVSDIGLPGLNGRQMADGARAKRPDLKVLLMTGYASTAAGPAGFLAPGMELITKPFATPVLAERIQRMLRPG